MPSTHRLQANFSQRIGQEIVIPSGAQVMVFWGTGGDAIETNRVSGGPTLAVSSGTPVHTANSINLGHQPAGAPTRFDVIDTTIALNSANFAAGYTWAAVARSAGEATNFNVVVSNMTLASGQGTQVDQLGLQQNTNRVILGGGTGNRANIQLTQPVNTNWHFIAMTCTGGATPTLLAYEFTENQAGQVSAAYNPTGRTLIATATTHLGCMSVETSTFIGPCEHAFSYVGTGAMSQANLAALASSVRPWLARRGITM